MYSFLCRKCGCGFSSTQSKARYCSTVCRKDVARDRASKQAVNRRMLQWRLFQRDDFKCQYCGWGREDGVRLTLDHVVPRFEGGDDTAKNLLVSCADCNYGKGKRRLTHEQEQLYLADIAKRNAQYGIDQEQRFSFRGSD